VLALPLSWKLLGDWLTRFDSRVGLNPAWFALSLGLLVVAIVGIGLGKFSAMNGISPAQSLKHE